MHASASKSAAATAAAAALVLLGTASPAEAAHCFSVEYAGNSFSAEKGSTTFSYRLSTSGAADCEPVSEFSLDGRCPGPCVPSSASSSSWSFKNLLAGGASSEDLHVVVSGKAQASCNGQWSVSTASSTEGGLTCVPDCSGGGPEPTAPQATCPIQFIQDEVTLGPGQSAVIDVFLGGDPEAEVTVNLESNCAFLSACSLTFTPGNFEIPQTVVLTSGDFNDATVCFLRASTAGEVCGGNELQINQPQEPNGQGGIIYGDPHVVSFANTRFQVPGIGVYTLVQAADGEYTVQVGTDSCARKGICTFELAIQKGTFVATLVMDLEGNLVEQENGLAAENGVTFEIRDGRHWYYLTTGLRVAARAGYTPSNQQYSLMVAVTAGASNRGQVAGLLGSYSAPKNEDLLLPGGTFVPFASVSEFVAAWEVTDLNLNLFESYPAAVEIPVVTGFTPFDPASIEFTCVSA